MIHLFKHRRLGEDKSKLIITLGFIFLIIFALPVLMFGGVPTVVPVSAEKGSVYITELESSSKNSILQLGGEWEVYPNRLLTPSDFLNQTDEPVQYAVFPHSWQNEPETYPNASGTATYRLTGVNAGTLDSIGVYSRFQFGAYKIFINGIEVLEIGHLSENPSDYCMSYQSGNAYLCPANSDTFEIIIQIQNYDHALAGFTGSIYFGDMAHIKYFTEFLLLLNGIMIGFLLLLLVYFIVIYFQERSKTLYLNFAIVTLMSLYVTMTTCNEAITYSIVPSVSPHIIFKLEYITQLIAALFSTQYIVKKYSKNKLYQSAIVWICVLVSAAIIVAPSMEVSKWRIPFQIAATSYYIVPLFLAGRASTRERSKTALWEFISLLTLISGIFFTKLGMVLWSCVDMFPIMVTLYCFIQVVVLMYYYTGVEGDLKKLNQTLEVRIEERTRELIASNEKAEAATAAKSDFLAQMSHEIRTPMNAIIGMSDLIQTDNLNETQKAYFRDIKEVSHSLLHIVNDILDFSKIESGKFQIAPVHFNFITMIDNICSLFYYSAKAKGLRFESNVDISIPAVLYGDETRIRQAVSNILSNAIKYTKKGMVRFSVERIDEGRGIQYTVTDSGVGIKPEDLPRLFKLFEQLDKSDSVKGTGLGLAICKQLTELMGGSVTVESEYGVGSTFTICLPMTEGDPLLVESVEIKERIYADNAKVLVVDDNSINITVAKGIFATHSIIPDSAESGFEAIELARGKDYDIIFMDHMMPEMDGIEATAAIRALGGHNQTVPIVALTANAVTGAREFLIESGMTDFISKPINRTAMNNILAKWLPFDLIETRLPEEEAKSAGELQELAEVPGLDIEKGLAYTGGNADTYKAILRQFVFETPAYAEKLAPALDKLDTYAVIVHGIKGSLNSIGAEWLGGWALNLEMSAKAGDSEVCAAQTERFTGAVLNFIDMLAPLLTEADSETVKQHADTEQLQEILEPLQMACVLGDCTVIDELSSALKHLSFGGPYDTIVSELVAYCENMQYDMALQIIEELRG